MVTFDGKLLTMGAWEMGKTENSVSKWTFHDNVMNILIGLQKKNLYVIGEICHVSVLLIMWPEDISPDYKVESLGLQGTCTMFHIAAKRQDRARRKPPKTQFVCCDTKCWLEKFGGDKPLNVKIAEPL